MALVPYVREPVFTFAPAGCERVCVYDPYQVLRVPSERADALVELCKGLRTSCPRSQEAVARRTAAIRAAYRELAARFHPDAAGPDARAGAPLNRAYPWISQYEYFSAISTSYRVLSDLFSTLEYHVAACEGGFADEAEAQMRARLLRELRYHTACVQRSSMREMIANATAEQAARTRMHGDGLLVRVGLYGDARVMSMLHPLLRGGQPFDAATELHTDRVIDVCGVLQAAVELISRHNDSESKVVQLMLPAGSKVDVEGFWDPADGDPKMLFVRYEFLGTLHECLCDDEAAFKAPLKKHAVGKIGVLQPPATASKPPRAQLHAPASALRPAERTAISTADAVLRDSIHTNAGSPARVLKQTIGSPAKSTRGRRSHPPTSASASASASRQSSDAENGENTPLSSSFVTCVGDDSAIGATPARTSLSSQGAPVADSEEQPVEEVCTYVKDPVTGEVKVSLAAAPASRVPSAALIPASAVRKLCFSRMPNGAARQPSIYTLAPAHTDASDVSGSAPTDGSGADGKEPAADVAELLRTLRARAAQKYAEEERQNSWFSGFTFFRRPSWRTLGLCAVVAAAVLWLWMRRGTHARLMDRTRAAAPAVQGTAPRTVVAASVAAVATTSGPQVLK